MSVAVRRFTIVSLMAFLSLLGGCATPRPHAAWTDQQVAMLRSEGFVSTARGWEFSMNDRLLFGTDESNVLPAQAMVVTRIATRLLGVGIDRATIEGHTDNTGTSQHNHVLAKQRADAVASVMVGGGFARANVRSVSLGELYPAASNRTADGRHENRRVVILVTAQ
jgi:OOP family OmpA-OmpF porin